MTSAEVWAPAFHRAGFRWLENMKPEDIFRQTRHGLHCILCETYNDYPIEEHAKRHRAEYREWLLRKELGTRAEARKRLREINRLKKESSGAYS